MSASKSVMLSACVPDSVEVDVLLVLAGDQVHHGEGVGGGHVAHPVRHASVRPVQVIIVAVLKYLKHTPLVNITSRNITPSHSI